MRGCVCMIGHTLVLNGIVFWGEAWNLPGRVPGRAERDTHMHRHTDKEESETTLKNENE